MDNIKVSAPGRICLFGEHQDYLGLPVITSSIDLRVQITATPREDKIINISLPDINSSEILDISSDDELDQKLGSFVLGDSGQPKNTMFILGNVKNKVLSAVEKIKEKYSDFELFTHNSNDAEKFRGLLTAREYEVLEGALINREFTFKALKLLENNNFNHNKFGKLLTEHHEILDKKLNISTAKINRMISSAIEAGALGGKINGSGGGGCMFVYAPDNPGKVAQAIEKEGGKAYIVNVGQGLTVERY